jgi:hypothetical protein
MTSRRSDTIWQTIKCIDVDGQVICPPLNRAQRRADRAGTLDHHVCITRTASFAERQTWCARARPRLEAPLSAAERYAASTLMRAASFHQPAALSADDRTAWRQIGDVCIGAARHRWQEINESHSGLHAFRQTPGDRDWAIRARRVYVRRFGDASRFARTVGLEAQREERPDVELPSGRVVTCQAIDHAAALHISATADRRDRGVAGAAEALVEALRLAVPDLTTDDVETLTAEDITTLVEIARGRLTEEQIAHEAERERDGGRASVKLRPGR